MLCLKTAILEILICRLKGGGGILHSDCVSQSEHLVSVVLITYNHINYIERAVNSVLSQKTNFNFKLKIYDDASYDGTSDIVRRYAAKYPDKIDAYINTVNQGCPRNILNALSGIDTKYYAYLETDDYWCDDYKLQKQIDVLEKNPDCSFCGHNTKTYSCIDKTFGRPFFNIETQKIELNQLVKDFTFDKFIKVHLSSRVYRTACLDLESLKNKEIIVWDSSSFWYFLTKGKLYYINEVMSIYNYTETGVFSGAPQKMRQFMALRNINAVNKELDYKYNSVFLKLFRQFIPLSFFKYIKLRYLFNKRRLNKFYTKTENNFFKVKYFMSNGYNNLGDALNKYIIEKMAPENCIFAAPQNCNLIAIGSILDQHFFINSVNNFVPEPVLNIWGAGFISSYDDIKKTDSSISEKFSRNVKIYALRGRLSKERCEKILNINLDNIALGDPGLLACRLLDSMPAKKYDVGIIPHYADKNSDFIKNIRLKNFTFKVIDITADTIETLKDIASCRCILSSALHGLITADSFNIPNKWIKLSDKVFGSGYKFRDYYSVYNIDNPEPVDLSREIITDETVKQITGAYPVKYSKVLEIQEKLISAFPS